MLRFRTGDETKYELESCACGRTHMRLSGISGRTDDLVIAKGVKFYPSQVEEMLRRIPELTNEFQIIVNRGEDYVDGVSVRAEACYGDWAEIRERIQRDLRAVVGIRFDVELLQPGTLPRTMQRRRGALN